MARRALLVLVVAAVVGIPGSVAAQEPRGTTSSSVDVPTQEIVPEPNSGEAPSEAGDRGGPLQLGLLAVVVLVIAGAVAALVRQSRRARGLD